jgi:hypothetical protein
MTCHSNFYRLKTPTCTSDYLTQVSEPANSEPHLCTSQNRLSVATLEYHLDLVAWNAAAVVCSCYLQAVEPSKTRSTICDKQNSDSTYSMELDIQIKKSCPCTWYSQAVASVMLYGVLTTMCCCLARNHHLWQREFKNINIQSWMNTNFMVFQIEDPMKLKKWLLILTHSTLS